MGARVAIVRADLVFSVRARHKIAAGEVVVGIHGTVRDRPSVHSLQVDVARHIDVPDGVSLHEELDDYAHRFLNHSCRPNAAVRDREVVALRDVGPWDEVTLDYNTTEYEITRPFRCMCEHEDCEGAEVAGFRHLTDQERDRLRPHLSDHLRSWWDAQRSK